MKKEFENPTLELVEIGENYICTTSAERFTGFHTIADVEHFMGD